MPGNEESVVAQGSEEMRSPLFEKSVRKADSIQDMASVPGKEKRVVAQGSEEKRSPLFKK